jgi:hypothetical protein
MKKLIGILIVMTLAFSMPVSALSLSDIQGALNGTSGNSCNQVIQSVLGNANCPTSDTSANTSGANAQSVLNSVKDALSAYGVTVSGTTGSDCTDSSCTQSDCDTNTCATTGCDQPDCTGSSCTGSSCPTTAQVSDVLSKVQDALGSYGVTVPGTTGTGASCPTAANKTRPRPSRARTPRPPLWPRLLPPATTAPARPTAPVPAPARPARQPAHPAAPATRTPAGTIPATARPA